VPPDSSQMQSMQFGGGVSGSVFSPIALAAIVIAGLLICFLPRSRAIVPFFVMAILIPYDQILVVGSLHFPMLRILALFGLIRIFWAKLSGKDVIFSGGVNGIDKALIVLALFTAVDGILLWRQSAYIVYQLGQLFTSFGAYFLLRYLIRDEEDVRRTLRAWACVAVVLAGIMVCEQLTGKNPLYMAIGGARAELAQAVIARDGALRSTGSFAHPILAGTFGGFSLPLFVGLWWNKSTGDRKYALAGAIASIAIAFAASSSTALLGAMGGIMGLCFWPWRRKMRFVRWAIVGTLAAGHLYMTSPVWHIISDIDFTGSSSSYHRYMLVDQCIRHFSSWFLVGTKDFGTWGWDMWDLSDQYVWTADTAGVVPLISLLAILVFGFRYLGKSREAAAAREDRKQELFIWALAASLFSNVVAFIGISYFDQTIVAWYAILAMISTMTWSVRNAQLEPKGSAAMLESERGFHSQLEPRPLRGHGSVLSRKIDSSATTQ
jgi:hypothetical protein